MNHTPNNVALFKHSSWIWGKCLIFPDRIECTRPFFGGIKIIQIKKITGKSCNWFHNISITTSSGEEIELRVPCWKKHKCFKAIQEAQTCNPQTTNEEYEKKMEEHQEKIVLRPITEKIVTIPEKYSSDGYPCERRIVSCPNCRTRSYHFTAGTNCVRGFLCQNCGKEFLSEGDSTELP